MICLRMMIKAMSVVFLVLASAAVPAPPDVVSPFDPALERMRSLGVSEAGVDEAGNLWAWSRQRERIELIAPDGKLLAGQRLGYPTLAVDADAEWGIAHVGLDSGGRRLEVSPWRRGPYYRVPLPHFSVAVQWVGPWTVAVAPATADHLLEIWDVRSGRLLGKWGTVQRPDPDRSCGVRLRQLEVRFCSQLARVYTLDTFTGEMAAYSFNGEVVWEHQIPLPDSVVKPSEAGPSFKVEERRCAQAETSSIERRMPTFQLDSGCNVVLLHRSPAQSPSELVVETVSSHQEPSRRSVVDLAERCPGRNFLLFEDLVVQYFLISEKEMNCVKAWRYQE